MCCRTHQHGINAFQPGSEDGGVFDRIAGFNGESGGFKQIQAGGMDSVRGYYEGEAAGDAGWRLRAEVKTPSLLEVGGMGLRAIGFIEGAQLWLNSPLPGQTSEFSLASIGLGLRLKGEKNGPFFMLDAGYALKAGPRTERGSQRVNARLGYEF